MRVLLDTHAVLWFINEHEKLSTKAKSILLDDKHELYISIASLWEVAIKVSLGKLTGLNGGVGTLIAQIEKTSIELLKISPRHIEIVESLPFIHRDPFDRVLIATAKFENITILTSDENVQKYDVSTVW